MDFTWLGSQKFFFLVVLVQVPFLHFQNAQPLQVAITHFWVQDMPIDKLKVKKTTFDSGSRLVKKWHSTPRLTVLNGYSTKGNYWQEFVSYFKPSLHKRKAFNGFPVTGVSDFWTQGNHWQEFVSYFNLSWHKRRAFNGIHVKIISGFYWNSNHLMGFLLQPYVVSDTFWIKGNHLRESI